MKNAFLILTLYLISGLETLLPDPDRIELIERNSPEITFEINPHDTSIVLEQIKMPTSTRVHFVLSSLQKEMNWQTLIRESLNPEGADKGMILDQIETDQNICFEQLQSQTTYYLYYFIEDNETKQKSQIIKNVIEVGDKNKGEESNLTNHHNPHISYELFSAEFFRTMASVCIPAFLIYFISLFLQKMDQVPDECFSLSTNRETLKPDENDDPKHEIQKILDLSSRSFFRLFHRANSTGRQEEEEIDFHPDQTKENPHQRIEDENQELEERRVCGICCQRSRDIIFLNCGHAYCCYVCSLSLTVCPFDQKPICTRLRFSISRNHETECYSNELAASLCSSSSKIPKTSSKIRASNSNSNFDSEREILLKLQNNFLKKLMKCVVCNQNNKDVFFLNCGHVICCSSCAKKFTTCPFDYIPITKIYQAYFP